MVNQGRLAAFVCLFSSVSVTAVPSPCTTAGPVIVPPPATCKGPPAFDCNDPCEPVVTSGWTRKPDFDTIKCPVTDGAPKCSKATCCDPPTTVTYTTTTVVTHCKDYDCNDPCEPVQTGGWMLKKDTLDDVCPLTGCTKELCCHTTTVTTTTVTTTTVTTTTVTTTTTTVTTTTVTYTTTTTVIRCKDYDCNDACAPVKTYGWTPKHDARDKICPIKGCTKDMCCEPPTTVTTTTTTTVLHCKDYDCNDPCEPVQTSGWMRKKHSLDDVCPFTGCTKQLCCHTTTVTTTTVTTTTVTTTTTTVTTTTVTTTTTTTKTTTVTTTTTTTTTTLETCETFECTDPCIVGGPQLKKANADKIICGDDKDGCTKEKCCNKPTTTTLTTTTTVLTCETFNCGWVCLPGGPKIPNPKPDQIQCPFDGCTSDLCCHTTTVTTTTSTTTTVTTTTTTVTTTTVTTTTVTTKTTTVTTTTVTTTTVTTTTVTTTTTTIELTCLNSFQCETDPCAPAGATGGQVPHSDKIKCPHGGCTKSLCCATLTTSTTTVTTIEATCANSFMCPTDPCAPGGATSGQVDGSDKIKCPKGGCTKDLCCKTPPAMTVGPAPCTTAAPASPCTTALPRLYSVATGQEDVPVQKNLGAQQASIMSSMVPTLGLLGMLAFVVGTAVAVFKWRARRTSTRAVQFMTLSGQQDGFASEENEEVFALE